MDRQTDRQIDCGTAFQCQIIPISLLLLQPLRMKLTFVIIFHFRNNLKRFDVMFLLFFAHPLKVLILSRRRPLSYRNRPIDLLRNNSLHLERVKEACTSVNVLAPFSTASKVSKYGVFSGPYFPVFGLNTEIYSVNLRIQSEYPKIRIRKNSYLDTFDAV